MKLRDIILIAGATLASSYFSKAKAQDFESEWDAPAPVVQAEPQTVAEPVVEESAPAPEEAEELVRPVLDPISDSSPRLRLGAYAGQSPEMTYGFGSMDLYIPLDDFMLGFHGLGGVNQNNIRDDDPIGTLYQTQSDSLFGQGLLGFGLPFDVDGRDGLIDDSALELRLGFQYFDLARKDSEDILDVARSPVLGLAFNLSDYFTVEGEFAGLEQDEYHALSGRVALDILRVNSEGPVGGSFIAGGSAHYAWLRETEQLFAEAYAGIQLNITEYLSLGGTVNASWGEIYEDKTGARLDRLGRYAGCGEDRELSGMGGSGFLRFNLPGGNTSVYAILSSDDINQFSMAFGLQYSFGTPLSRESVGRRFSPGYIAPPPVLDPEGGGPGVQ